jgi:hypothetical protein
MVKFIRFYREHPAEFAEGYLGCKLYPYQKELINKMNYVDSTNPSGVK